MGKLAADLFLLADLGYHDLFVVGRNGGTFFLIIYFLKKNLNFACVQFIVSFLISNL